VPTRGERRRSWRPRRWEATCTSPSRAVGVTAWRSSATAHDWRASPTTARVVIDVNSRAATPIAASPTGQPARDVGNDRIRQTLGTVVAPNDGEFLVRLETTAALDGVAIDSLLVSQLPSGRALSQSFGMLALGGLVFLVVLAIGGLLGRSVLDADAT
jgi:hypothetical protein